MRDTVGGWQDAVPGAAADAIARPEESECVCS